MKRLLISLAVLLVITMFFTPVHAKTTLKMVTFLPKGNVNMTAWMAFVDAVNGKGKRGIGNQIYRRS